MRAAIAGTFGPLHDGHRALIWEALEHSDEGAVVGLNSSEFATETRRPDPWALFRACDLLYSIAQNETAIAEARKERNR